MRDGERVKEPETDGKEKSELLNLLHIRQLKKKKLNIQDG